MKLSHRNEADINALIPEAIRHADKKMRVEVMFHGGAGRATQEWSEIFSAKMDELTIAAGLRVGYKDLIKVRDSCKHK